ncbi:fluorescence recovery protein [Synechococcus sp. RS9909]|uniref:hypothetical protein n=1 Tax=unclassified Synechococcus TaxID=2626047 RepID=UPI0000690DFC|nr:MULTISPECIES: hypothetical protein [unclassified Synechococcus]EAQ68830.1 hypothetical protein RS9917_00682 [Synechococcus sp. RS9917]QNI79030.1 fluorescence recovery protein [Synechococcus sp. RS9909]
MSATDWSQDEIVVARHAFERGNQKSIEVLIASLQEQVNSLNTAESIWKLHDFLSTERFDYEGRSEFDDAKILFILADMVKRKLISRQDLVGLSDKKISKIKAMAMF